MRRGFIYSVLICLVVFWGTMLLWPVVSVNPAPGPNTRATTELDSMLMASHAYRHHYGHFPTGTLVRICRSLSGENPRGIMFIEMRDDLISESGEFLDPWGTPYHISWQTMTNAIASSAGKDRIFDTLDDTVRTK